MTHNGSCRFFEPAGSSVQNQKFFGRGASLSVSILSAAILSKCEYLCVHACPLLHSEKKSKEEKKGKFLCQKYSQGAFAISSPKYVQPRYNRIQRKASCHNLRPTQLNVRLGIENEGHERQKKGRGGGERERKLDRSIFPLPDKHSDQQWAFRSTCPGFQQTSLSASSSTGTCTIRQTRRTWHRRHTHTVCITTPTHTMTMPTWTQQQAHGKTETQRAHRTMQRRQVN